jgi:DNA invertase Pin-like site-specific DNA recombinase
MSESAFPSLGSNKVAAAVPKVALNFKKTVIETAAREEQEEEEERQRKEAEAAAKKPSRHQMLVPRRHIPSHCYDDGPQDDEVDYHEDDRVEAEEKEDEAEGAGEFNAHLQTGRRRGDKGIW